MKNRKIHGIMGRPKFPPTLGGKLLLGAMMAVGVCTYVVASIREWGEDL